MFDVAFAFHQKRDFSFVGIKTNYTETFLSESESKGEAYVTESDYTDHGGAGSDFHQ
jgi:hypothetical protein